MLIITCFPGKLESTWRPAIFQATYVCKRWHYISRSLIHRALNLIISSGSQKRNEALFKQLEGDSDLRQMLREIHVHDWYVSELVQYHEDRPSRLNWAELCSRKDLSETRASTLNQLDRLCELISSCSLKDFKWVGALNCDMTIC